jgi:signal transduction histidine kinase
LGALQVPFFWLLLGQQIGQVLELRDFSRLNTFALMLLGLFAIMAVGAFLQTYFLGAIGERVVYDLRTPLTVLEGNLRAALDRVYPLDEAEIANLYGQTRHLIRLVNDLHELALRPIDPAELIGETMQPFAPLAEEQGVAVRQVAGHLPQAMVDAVRMRQVLHNLLSNALRHTPRGGEITVSGALEGSAVVIAVADTGDGLEPEQLGAVFDRFYAPIARAAATPAAPGRASLS